MKAVKTETTIKQAMEAFVAERGLTNTTTTVDGVEYRVLGANRFHFAQITLTSPDHGTWRADYTKSGKLGTPKHIQQNQWGGWELAK